MNDEPPSPNPHDAHEQNEPDREGDEDAPAQPPAAEQELPKSAGRVSFRHTPGGEVSIEVVGDDVRLCYGILIDLLAKTKAERKNGGEYR